MSRLARGVGRAVKVMLIVPAVLVALAFAIVLTVLLVPGILLNDPVLRHASQWVNEGDSGARIDWGRLEVDWEVPRFLARTVSIRFDHLRLDLPGMGGTFQRQGSVAFQYDLRRIVPRLREIGPMHLSGGHTAVRIAAQEVAEEAAEEAVDPDEGVGFDPAAWLGGTVLRDILIEEQTWTVATEGATASGDARLLVTPQGGADEGDAGGVHMNALVRHRIHSGAARHRGELRMNAYGDRNVLAQPWDVDLESTVGDGDFGRGRTHVVARIDEDGTTWRLSSDWEHPEASIEARMAGTWDGRLRAGIEGEARGARPLDPLGAPILRVAGCRLEWTGEDGPGGQTAGFDCPLRLSVTAQGGPDAGESDASESDTGESDLVGVRVVGAFEAVAPSEDEERIASRLELYPETLWLGEAQGHARVSWSLVPDDPGRPQDLSVDVDLRLGLPRFERAVDVLEGTRYAVPAPLHELEGPVELVIRSRGEAPPDLELVSTLTTRLRSEHQRVVMDLGARLRTQGDWPEEGPLRFELAADLLLRDIALRLPPLEGAPPGLAPDSRIQPRIEEAETEIGDEGAFDYSLRLRSEAGHPIGISAPVTGEMIPLSADVVADSGEPVRGRIGIGAFPLEVAGFERDVKGGELYLRLSDVKEEAAGELVFDAEGRSIDMSLAEMSGLFTPMPEPKPPLALGQIVSSLLIGRAVDVAVVAQEARDQPPTAPGEAPTSLEFQYRY